MTWYSIKLKAIRHVKSMAFSCLHTTWPADTGEILLDFANRQVKKIEERSTKNCL